MNPTRTYSNLQTPEITETINKMKNQVALQQKIKKKTRRMFLISTSAPSPNRAPSENLVLVLWKTAALRRGREREREREWVKYTNF